MAKSIPEIIFDSVNDEDSLLGLVSNQVENLHLDYKTKRDHSTAQVDDDLQKNLSKGISGFANSDGGVLVIGIDSRKGEPNKLKPILPLKEFEQEVNTYASRATNYPVNGIKVKAIELSSQKGGIILLYAPKSDLTPHCSPKDRKYYLRIGDSFKQMEHYQLLDVFGRRHHPLLVPCATVENDINSLSRIEIILMIENEGRGVARFPYFELDPNSHFKISEYELGNGRGGLPERIISARRQRAYVGGVNDVIHPGIALELTKLRGNFSISHPETIPSVEISGKIASEGFDIKSWKITLESALIIHLLEGQKQKRTAPLKGELL